MQLYSFFNSSTSYRVRIALALKGLPYDYLAVNIRTGQHRHAEYVDGINPSASVPALVDGDFTLGQSFAIIDYLDARHPEPRLLPQDPEQRARAGAVDAGRLRYPPGQQPARAALPAGHAAGHAGAEGRLVPPLDRRRHGRRRAAAGAPWPWQVVLRQCTHAGRCRAGAAGGQCAAHGLRAGSLPARDGRLRPRQCPSRLRPGCARAPAGLHRLTPAAQARRQT
ncbi:hypothetical protein CBM2609_B70134 [Cupriavidus taiwanensis]|nr:hypothetical protein CBM2604_B60132 [Cupriavidus taiwanensis]SOZ33190.1 hypothetical protein CBM2609_B70134 [Cupriavidus taiwanensis]SOZ48502.1 hypothetical protein CBM2610_B50131 [Cupriavidus taiwanensis]